jgi:hypothetical protein
LKKQQLPASKSEVIGKFNVEAIGRWRNQQVTPADEASEGEREKVIERSQ